MHSMYWELMELIDLFFDTHTHVLTPTLDTRLSFDIHLNTSTRPTFIYSETSRFLFSALLLHLLKL